MNWQRWRHYARGWLLHFLGRNDGATAAYGEAFRHDGQDVRSARHLAYIAAQRYEFATALSWFDEALRIQPADAATHFNRGYALEQMGRPGQAVGAFREALRLDPKLDRAWYGLGLAHAALGEHGEAVCAFDEATRLQPMNAQAWYQLGMACHCADAPGRVGDIATHLIGLDLGMARQLVCDSGRGDLAALIPQLPFWAAGKPPELND